MSGLGIDISKSSFILTPTKRRKVALFKKIMTTTKLRPLAPNLSIYEEEEESIDEGEVIPPPKKDDGSGDDVGGDDGGFGLEGDLIETPGEEEF